jgi:hypothetical protein
MSSYDDFFTKHYAYARAAGLPDIAARLAAVQASIESGWGTAAPGNNYLGIKAGKSWAGQKQRFPTHEDNGKGQKYVTRDTFRAYESVPDNYRDWAQLIARKWPDVLSAENFEAALAGLKEGTPGAYASDSDYNHMVRDRYRRFERSRAVPKYNFATDPVPSYWRFPPEVYRRRAAISMMNGGVLGLDGRTGLETPVVDRPDPMDTRSIPARRAGGPMMPMPGGSDSVVSYARLLRSLLGGVAPARPVSAPQNGQAAMNDGRMDTVAVTRMIRQMQQAGASADEIKQMIAESRRRASGARTASR